ncbi:MAG: pantetheine-phosphate adenylyltransferase [Bdellovibrionales bacterium]
MRKAIYPGSFDPITRGHMDLIERASRLFSELYVLISVSSQKQALFTEVERQELIKKSLPHLKNLHIHFASGLTTDFMKAHDIQVLVRGLRQVEDFEYEKSMAQYNQILFPDVETVLMYANPSLAFVSSRGVKEVARHAKSTSELEKFLSPPVAAALIKRMQEQK